MALYVSKYKSSFKYFEERYIDMVDYSLSNNKIIGMIQHKRTTKNYTVLVVMQKLHHLMRRLTKGILLTLKEKVVLKF